MEHENGAITKRHDMPEKLIRKFTKVRTRQGIQDS
jgi:hypothetical protein